MNTNYQESAHLNDDQAATNELDGRHGDWTFHRVQAANQHGFVNPPESDNVGSRQPIYNPNSWLSQVPTPSISHPLPQNVNDSTTVVCGLEI
jgi:hypothetical protein